MLLGLLGLRRIHSLSKELGMRRVRSPLFVLLHVLTLLFGLGNFYEFKTQLLLLCLLLSLVREGVKVRVSGSWNRIRWDVGLWRETLNGINSSVERSFLHQMRL